MDCLGDSVQEFGINKYKGRSFSVGPLAEMCMNVNVGTDKCHKSPNLFNAPFNTLWRLTTRYRHDRRNVVVNKRVHYNVLIRGMVRRSIGDIGKK